MKKRLASLFITIAVACIFGLAEKSRAQKYGGTLNLGMYSDISNPDLHRSTGKSHCPDGNVSDGERRRF
jgi:hypothetical protein